MQTMQHHPARLVVHENCSRVSQSWIKMHMRGTLFYQASSGLVRSFQADGPRTSESTVLKSHHLAHALYHKSIMDFKTICWMTRVYSCCVMTDRIRLPTLMNNFRV